MKSFFFSFGWNQNIVINTVIRYSMVKEDRIFLCTPEEYHDDRSEAAANTLKNLLSNMPDKPSIEEIKVPVLSFYGGLFRVLRIMANELDGHRFIYINVSGGMRVLNLILYVAGLIAINFYPRSVFFTKLDLEVGKENVELPALPLVLPRLDKSRRRILMYLKFSGPSSRSDAGNISCAMNIPRSSLSRYLDELERNGFVEWEKVGKKKFYRLTNRGEFYVNILEIFRK